MNKRVNNVTEHIISMNRLRKKDMKIMIIMIKLFLSHFFY